MSAVHSSKYLQFLMEIAKTCFARGYKGTIARNFASLGMSLLQRSIGGDPFPPLYFIRSGAASLEILC